MRTMVLLRHELPDGAFHFDWLIDAGAGRDLIAFRVLERFDRGEVVEFEAVRLEDHRRLYLEYEGPISRNRGEVTRVGRGSIAVLAEEDGRLRVVGGIGRWVGAIAGIQVRGDQWRMHVVG